MSDTYSNNAPPPDAPEYPSDQPDQPSAPDEKASQQEVNYREGNPQRSCGLCGNFDSKEHGCETVDGDISAFGYCDIYQRQDNPFRTGETEAFEGGTDVTPPAPEVTGGPDGPMLGGGGPPLPPGLQIGNRRYGP